MRALTLVTSLSLLLAATTGCMEQVEQTGNAGTGLYAFAMTENTPAFIETDEAALYWIEHRIEFPIQPPTDEEAAELAAMAAPVPFPSHPWVVLGDIGIELDLVVTNLTDERRVTDITINGINEFHEYVPSFTLDDDEIIPDFSQWERAVVIEPGEQYIVTIRERELTEIATDLATVVNGAPNANEVVYFENQSGPEDLRIDPYIPELIPGLTGLRIGLRAAGASNIVVEASIRLVDWNDRVSDDEEDPEQLWELPVPAVFTPAPYVEP